MLSHPLPPTVLLPTSIKQFLTLLTNSLFILIQAFYSDIRTNSPSATNLKGLYTLLAAHPTTLPHFLHTTHQRTIHAVLSKCLMNSDPLIKFLAIASLAIIVQHELPEDSQDHPRSLFHGAKGTKVLKLVISTVLAELASQKEESTKIIRLCGTSVSAIDPSLVSEWAELKNSGQQLAKLQEKADGLNNDDLLTAVMHMTVDC